MKLFAIHDEIERILTMESDRETGEITGEALEKLDALELALEAKALAIAAYLKGEIAEGEAVAEQARRLGERARRHKNRAERLKAYLAKHCEGRSFRDDKSEIGWRKSTSVEIEDEAALPIDCVEHKTVPLKKEIAAKIKAGGEVPGARLVTRQHLQVR